MHYYSTCNLVVPTRLLQRQSSLHGDYQKGLLISSLHLLECSFHMGYKLIVANVSMTRGIFKRGT